MASSYFYFFIQSAHAGLKSPQKVLNRLSQISGLKKVLNFVIFEKKVLNLFSKKREHPVIHECEFQILVDFKLFHYNTFEKKNFNRRARFTCFSVIFRFSERNLCIISYFFFDPHLHPIL